VTAVVAVPFAVLLLWSRARAVAEVLGGVVLTLGAVSLLSGRGFGWVTGLVGSGASVQWTAPSTAVGLTLRSLTGWDAVPVTRIAGIVALAVVLVVLWLRAARHGDVLRHAALALAATVVLAPVFHPWYATWPLALLAATLAHPTRWVTVPLAVASALCLPDGYNLSLAVKTQGAYAMTAFLLYLAYLAGKSVHEAKNRSRRDAGPDHAGDPRSGPEA
jgi:alpha-1,6-mannosyltransferase